MIAISNKDKHKLWEENINGLSVNKISKKYKMSIYTVSKIIKEEQLKWSNQFFEPF